GERFRVPARIGDGHLVEELAELRTTITFDGVQLLGVRVAGKVEPELVVEADRVDDERVAFESSDRVAVPRRIGICRMRTAVHEDLPVAVDVALEQEEHVRGRLQDAPWIRRLARHAGWEA